jgi:hypothetical protein
MPEILEIIKSLKLTMKALYGVVKANQEVFIADSFRY